MKKILLTIFGGVLVFVLGLVFGIHSTTTEESPLGKASESRLGGSGFTNPLLECEVGAQTIGAPKENFLPDLESFVAVLKRSRGLTDLAVYYRDLNNGPVIGVDQDAPFIPASLLKVPIMMAYLSWAEREPAILKTVLLYENPQNAYYKNQISPETMLEAGKSYTTQELIERMIKYSDNQALILLFKQLPIEEHRELYSLLGVDEKVISDPTASLSVRQYSVFFRILFNASFLSQHYSEYALGLLAQSSFNDGLRAGVPAAIPVAHKFGERKISGAYQQFHDCGIVYYPQHPYLLCIMTRGEDMTSLAKSIAETSEFVYKKIDEQYGK